ncbi:MAG: hypothetical protein JWP44_4455, partial [Mucilaginibacter sp.]|nr:hypothetical protein [Mucilaginibacter sp.]
PGSSGPGNTRGESENFLHDLVTYLDQAGVQASKSRSTFDRQQLLDIFASQLQLLGEQYQRSGRKTVILIDGLDHVPREQRPQNSMLRDLPFPDSIPSGVHVLLGTQTDELVDIPASVRAALQDPERRVRMEPLSTEAVNAVIRKSDLAIDLNNNTREMVHRLSQGHPLALALLMNHLRGARSEAEVDKVLGQTEPYAGDIDRVYHAHWETIKDDHELEHLLAHIARVRLSVDLAWLYEWNPPDLITRFKRTLGHLFNRETEARWFFFHNSFKLFVYRRTVGVAGSTVDNNEQQLHRELADRCARSSPESVWSWELAYHYGKAGNHAAVLALATVEYFRNQLISFRPLEAILTDIRDAIRSAGAEKDFTALVRLVLVCAEMAQRSHGIQDTEVARLLQLLGHPDISIEHLFDGPTLRVSDTEALRHSRRLRKLDRETEARHLFEASERHALVKAVGGPAHQARETRESLIQWVRTAIQFRPIEHVVSFIQEVESAGDEFGRLPAERATQSLRNDLLFTLVVELRKYGKEADADRLEESYFAHDDKMFGAWYWLQVRRWRGDIERGCVGSAASVLQSVLEHPLTAKMDDEARLFLADGIFQTEGPTDRCKKLIAEFQQPKQILQHLTGNAKLQSFMHRFRLNRLLRAIGESVEIVPLVPNAEGSEYQPLVFLERAVVQIAFIWGDAWRGRYYTAADIGQSTSGLLRLYDRDLAQFSDRSIWHSITAVKSDLYLMLVDAVSQHGPDALESLRELLEKEWAHLHRGKLWPAELKRSLLLTLVEKGAEKIWGITQLKKLERGLLDGLDVSGRVEACKLQAEAWAKLRQYQDGQLWLQRMLQTSFGVGYRKDYQLEQWMRWVPIVNATDEAGVAERVAWFATAAVQLEASSEGRSARSAAEELIGITFVWSPRRAVKLLSWLRANGALTYSDCVARLLQGAVDSRERCADEIELALTQFLLRFSTRAYPRLAQGLIRKTFEIEGEAAAIDRTKRVAASVNVLALASTRDGWLRGLQDGLASVGVTGVVTRSDDRADMRLDTDTPDTRPQSLLLSDGTRVEGELLVRELSSVEGLLSLIPKAADGWFNWKPYFSAIVPKANLLDTRRLVAGAESLQDRSLILSMLSMRLCELGDRAAAWSTATNALRASREYGWTRWSDGGTRIEAIKALIASDQTRGRQTAFQIFVEDMSSSRSFANETAQNLTDIVPLLGSGVPIMQLWAEVRTYLFALCPDLEIGEPLTILSEPVPADTGARAITELLATHLCELVNLLNHGAQHALGKLIMRGSEAAVASLQALLLGSDDQAAPSVAVLESVARLDAGKLSSFTSQIQYLANHPNLAVWGIARDLAHQLGIHDLPFRPRINQPAIYDLQLPSRVSASSTLRRTIPKGEPISDPIEHLGYLEPFDIELSFVAETLGLPVANVLYRASAIMGSLKPLTEYDAVKEGAIRNALRSAGLEFTYHRPRSQAARHAMFRTISELLDAQMAPIERVWEILGLFRAYDPLMMLVDAVQRPTECGPIGGIDQHGQPQQNWLDSVDDARQRRMIQIDEWFVMGEATTLRNLGWKTPTEEVESAIFLEESMLGSGEVLFVPALMGTAEDYLTQRDRDDRGRLLIRKHYRGQDTDGGQWLALHPAIATQLGWSPANSGLFSWLDSNGKLAAKTVWWKDSSVDHQPPHFHDEVAEGWIVVVSSHAMKTLGERLGPLSRITRLTRTIGQGANERQRTSAFLERINFEALELGPQDSTS